MRWILLILLPAIVTAGLSTQHFNAFRNKMFRHYAAIKKKQNNDKCVSVDFVMQVPGVTNVLAFLDPAWPLSGRQAWKLNKLINHVQATEIPETSFFAIIKDNSNPSMINISDKTLDIVKELSPAKITIIKDNQDSKIWSNVKATRNQILVINKCSKLTHRFIVPWGIPHSRHLKSAILSAEKQPCSKKCPRNNFNEDLDPRLDAALAPRHLIRDPQNESDQKDVKDYLKDQTDAKDMMDPKDQKDNQEYYKNNDKEGEIDNKRSNDQSFGLKIIMHAPHYHGTKDPGNKFEYIEFNLDDPAHHKHIEEHFDDDDDDDVDVDKNVSKGSKMTGNIEFDSFDNVSYDNKFGSIFHNDDTNIYNESSDYSNPISIGPYDTKRHVTKKRKLDDYYYNKNY